MYPYKHEIQKQAVDIVFEHKRFTKEFNEYIETLTDESKQSLEFRRKKFLLDQLVEDLHRSFKKVNKDVFDTKVSNAQNKLDELRVDFLKGMLNDGLSIK